MIRNIEESREAISSQHLDEVGEQWLLPNVGIGRAVLHDMAFVLHIPVMTSAADVGIRVWRMEASSEPYCAYTESIQSVHQKRGAMEMEVVEDPRLENIVLESLDAMSGVLPPVHSVGSALTLLHPQRLVVLRSFSIEITHTEGEASKGIRP